MKDTRSFLGSVRVFTEKFTVGKNHLFTGITILGSATVMLAQAPSKPVAPTPNAPTNTAQQVVVTNPTTNPVPISGNVGLNTGTVVGISGTPSVAIANFPGVQTVAGTVGISGTPAVTVGNLPASPALVTNAPGTPVSTTNQVSLGASQAAVGIVAYTVPVGKRLVIEFASVMAFVDAGQGAYVQIDTWDSVGNFHPNVFTGTALPGSIVVGSQQMRLYADSAGPGELFLEFHRTNGVTGTASATISLSGYLVDQ